MASEDVNVLVWGDLGATARDKLSWASHWRISPASASLCPGAVAAVSVPKLSLLSEMEWLHLHLDAVKSDQSSVSEGKETSWWWEKGGNLRQRESYHSYKNTVFSLDVIEECWLQIRNRAGNYNSRPCFTMHCYGSHTRLQGQLSSDQYTFQQIRYKT